jgi:hypothetical protein
MTDKLTDEAIAAILDGCEGLPDKDRVVHPSYCIRAAMKELLEARAERAAKDAEIERLTKERDEAQSEMLAWRIAVQRLTPGGSEFTTPQSVIDWVVRGRNDEFEAKKRGVLAKRALTARVAELEEALEFYSNAGDYEERDEADSCGCCSSLISGPVVQDAGRRARAALGRDGA